MHPAGFSAPRLAAGTPAQYLGAVSVPLPPAAPLPTAELSQQAAAPDPRPAARAQLQVGPCFQTSCACRMVHGATCCKSLKPLRLPLITLCVSQSFSKFLLLLQALYPPFAVGARQPPAASHSPPAVSEVHLRRLDRDNILHRRAVAEILIGRLTAGGLPSMIYSNMACLM